MNFGWLANVFIMLVLWVFLLAFLFGFASTIHAINTAEANEHTGTMACLWALTGPALYLLFLLLH